MSRPGVVGRPAAKRRETGTLLVVLLVSVLAGCNAPRTTWIPEAEVYRSWKSWPEEPIDTPVPGHRDTIRLIYISPLALQVEVGADGTRVYPEDSIILKEVYSTSADLETRKPSRLTVMVKKPELEEAQGGWIWITKDPNGEREKLIDHEFCVDCHRAANSSHPYGDGNPGGVNRDYVFIPHQP